MKISDAAKPAAGNLSIALCISVGAQLIQIASGFLVPRLIADQLGRELLGVWDLGWSLTSYFKLLEGGIGTAVNRHIALYLSKNDITSVNRVVSSVAAVQRLVGILILAGCIALSFVVELFAKGLSGDNLIDARWLVIILGSSIGISLYGSVYTGVLAGCERWNLHHSIYALTNALAVVGMMASLSFGMGLVTMALVYWSTEVLGRIVRTVAAYRVCPGLSNRLRNADIATVKEMVFFGGKLYLAQISQIALNQTVSVMISAFLGPSALALYTRPRSLVSQASMFSRKYSIMLVPKAAILSGGAARGDRAAFAVESTRNGLFITLPFTALLAFSGKNLLSIWMGPDFANPLLITVLAVGFLFEIAYLPLHSILAGLNYHGRPALASTIGASVSVVGVGALLFAGQNDLSVIALAVTLPWSIVHGVYVPLYACARLRLPISRFILESWTRPLICMVPFIACLITANAIFPEAEMKALLTGGTTGGLLLFLTYLKWAFPGEATPAMLEVDTSNSKRAVV